MPDRDPNDPTPVEADDARPARRRWETPRVIVSEVERTGKVPNPIDGFGYGPC